MCGFFSFFGNTSKIRKEDFNQSLELIHHRGPDATGIYTTQSSNFILGHKRLSIIDLDKRSNQPFECEKFVLIFNGEIYNHQSLRREKLKETEFKTSSDTETLLEGLKKYGSEFLNFLEGMFSGVFVEKSSGQFIAFRDGFGIKPLYYYKSDLGLFFFSEIKSIKPFLNLKVNEETLNNYLLFENYPQGQTFYKDIGEVEPGVYLENTLDCIKQIKPVKKNWSGDKVTKGIEAYENSIKSHLLSDVSLGVYLSGGIDSSLVAGVASKHTQNLKGYTGYFDVEDEHYDERRFSRMVAKHNSIELEEVKITPEDFKRCFDSLNWSLEQPRMGMGSFSQYVVAERVKKDRKVVLAGHGGDELFAGYPMFKSFYLQKNLFNPVKSIKLLSTLKPKEWIWVGYVFFMKILKGKFFFAPTIFSNLKTKSTEKFQTSSRKNILEDLFQYYRTIYIPGLLSVEDKVSMAHSLETRVPLWSRDIYDYAEGVPANQKLKNGELKSFWKQLASKYLPDELLTAPKRGFPTPLRLWFKNELFDFCMERLDRKSNLDKIISQSERKKLLIDHKEKWLPFSLDERRSHKIWMLLCLESTFRQFEVEV